VGLFRILPASHAAIGGEFLNRNRNDEAINIVCHRGLLSMGTLVAGEMSAGAGHESE
jgi:hypothetical protein